MTAPVGVSVPDVIVALTDNAPAAPGSHTVRIGLGLCGRGLSLRVDVAVTQLVASPVDSGVG
jgi:hypothetical protein